MLCTSQLAVHVNHFCILGTTLRTMNTWFNLFYRLLFECFLLEMWSKTSVKDLFLRFFSFFSPSYSIKKSCQLEHEQYFLNSYFFYLPLKSLVNLQSSHLSSRLLYARIIYSLNLQISVWPYTVHRIISSFYPFLLVKLLA